LTTSGLAVMLDSIFSPLPGGLMYYYLFQCCAAGPARIRNELSDSDPYNRNKGIRIHNSYDGSESGFFDKTEVKLKSFKVLNGKFRPLTRKVEQMFAKISESITNEWI